MTTTDSRLRIVVTGLVGLHPVGGVAFDYLQYVIGLRRLGHDVYYYEDTWSWPYHPIQKTQVPTGDYSAELLRAFFARYAPDCLDRWHYLHLHEQAYGMSKVAMHKVLSTADLFINVSGANMLPGNLPENCVKVFLDTDPGYNQIVMNERFPWSENVNRWCDNVAAHDHHFTYAENIHGADCKIPKLGFNWKTTRMPVVLDLWSDISTQGSAGIAPWTTVMTWSAFKGPVIYDGVEYKSKGAEFEKLLNLPQRLDILLKVAVGGKDAPVTRLSDAGWVVEDGPAATLTPEDYRGFIQQSRGEISTAKHIYVALRTGWFSCRSACYLAAGKPVVVQDTGFSEIIPCGEGILSFTSIDEAVAGLRCAENDYERHEYAARQIAEEHFASERVLGDMLHHIGLG